MTKREAEKAVKHDEQEKKRKTHVSPNGHTVVDHNEWIEARKKLLEKEKQVFRQTLELAKERQQLPWEKVEIDYEFENVNGAPEKVKLSQLFKNDLNSLAVYHYMYAADQENGCSNCSFWVDGFEGSLPHLAQRVNFVVVAKADPTKLKSLIEKKKWSASFLSSKNSSFNEDFGVEFSEAAKQKGAKYNYQQDWPYCEQAPGLSVFHKEGNEIFHTYSTYAAGLSDLNVMFAVLDRIPEGRDEKGEGKRHMWWIKHKETYKQ